MAVLIVTEYSGVIYSFWGNGGAFRRHDSLCEITSEIDKRQPSSLAVVGVICHDSLDWIRRLRTRSATEKLPIAIIESHDATAGPSAAWLDMETRLRRLEQTPLKMVNGASREFAVDLRAREISIEHRRLVCSPIEFRLLIFFLRYPGVIFSRTELLRRTRAGEASVQPRIVDVLVRRIRDKIEINSAPQHLRTVRNVGYIFQKNGDLFLDKLTGQPFLSWPGFAEDERTSQRLHFES